eukprot:TRINITY_DN6117_c0_g4_i2.p1 TRINITY_DN6117_c0_g4~~TRINITY_DN6117_c0_g4_i2.p1  ORF type:complete len:508 (-),score=105.75 TRINITY_DN6117_c0_g4_i2:18-1541(-)
MTENNQMKHYLGLWILESRLSHFSLGEDLDFLLKKKFELVGLTFAERGSLSSLPSKEQLFQSIAQSLQVPLSIKNRTETKNFVNLIWEDFASKDCIITAFRLQADDQTFQEVQRSPVFTSSNLTATEQMILTLGKSADRPELISPKNALLDVLFFPINIEDLKQVSAQRGFLLYDDFSLQDSFVHDIPKQKRADHNLQTVNLPPGMQRSVCIIPYSISKQLNIAIILKKFEAKEFTIISMQTLQLTENLQIAFREHMASQFSNLLDEEKGLYLSNGELYYLIVLQRANAVFETKKIVSELVKSILISESKSFNPNQAQMEQLRYDLYASTNYEHSIEDLEMIQGYLEDQSNQAQITHFKEKRPTNLVFALIAQNDLIERGKIHFILQTIQSLKMRVLFVNVYERLSDGPFEKAIPTLEKKYNSKGLINFCKQRENVSAVFLLIEKRAAGLTSDSFGSFRLKEDGDLSMIYSGEVQSESGLEFSPLFADDDNLIMKHILPIFKASFDA